MSLYIMQIIFKFPRARDSISNAPYRRNYRPFIREKWRGTRTI